MYGTNDAKGAVAAIDRLAGPDWYAIFKDLHAGMIYDLSGNKTEAGKRFERAYKLDSSALRVVEAYGSWLSRNRSAKEALGVFEAFDKVLPRHPLVIEAMNQLKGLAAAGKGLCRLRVVGLDRNPPGFARAWLRAPPASPAPPSARPSPWTGTGPSGLPAGSPR